MDSKRIDAFRHRLGHAIRARRRAAGLTQETLAEATGSSTEWMSQVERGLGTPSIELLLRIAEAVDTPVVELVAAAESVETDRPLLQELLALATQISDDALRVLLATARALNSDPAGRSSRSQTKP